MEESVKSIEVPITFLELRLLLNIGVSELSEYVAGNLLGENVDTSELYSDKGALTESEDALVKTTTAKIIYLFNQFNGREYFNIVTRGQKLYLIMR